VKSTPALPLIAILLFTVADACKQEDYGGYAQPTPFSTENEILRRFVFGSAFVFGSTFVL
jgi:hypothetical protein